MTDLQSTLDDLIVALHELECAEDETVRQALARAPVDSTVHGIMARAWLCASCRGTGLLRELTICLGSDEDTECPHCGQFDTVVMLDDADGVPS